ncbi:hypothetical protein [Luteipulveratus mongoliensis]|uniref:Uncharacterized protein n=1 Tax=Luteipulveratus mongoliensis TaxID=571913 RepID=A0A0K1JEI4_9MICO|nr:hypothetical protein [Luteipulveratus mongoliensis]AKU15116.1 hypothetical protein VV02_03305 [Luteipulveratus mongoliensis]
MAAQLFTLLGVVVGAVGSFLATSAAERARYKRELATRWDERRLQIYIQFSTCVKDIAANAARSLQVSDDTKKAEFLEVMEQRELERSGHFETLMLLASASAIDAAHEVNQRIWDGLVATRNGEDPGDYGLVEALNALYSAARRDLGVDGLPQSL